MQAQSSTNRRATDSEQITVVDLVIVGSGTGLAAALSAHEQGLSVLVIEKTEYVGGSMARSGGAFWIPANPVLDAQGAIDSRTRGQRYLDELVGDTSPPEKLAAYLQHGSDAVRMMSRTTRMQFTWAKGYSDYHAEVPGGSAAGRSCECKPFDLSALGPNRHRLRPGVMAAPIPMPVTGGDYKWLNLMTRVPTRGLPRAIGRAAQGIGGLALGRHYAAGGQALAGGLYDGVLRAGIPIWTQTPLVGLQTSDGRVTGVRVRRYGMETVIEARRGVLLAAGGFDHNMAWRHEYQSPALDNWSLGADGNVGDAISAAEEIGAGTTLLDQAWWFPAIAPLPDAAPLVMLAERSLPGSFIVDRHGRRFVNEAIDYMSFGQRVLARERSGDPVGQMWIVFDQTYRNNYVFGGMVYPRMPLPKAWYDAGIAVRGASWADLADQMEIPAGTFTETGGRFNELAGAGVDDDYHRGSGAYDRYYGDPTNVPNPNLRPLHERELYAVKVVLSDLGTCGGLITDQHARVLRENGTPIDRLYAIGNTAGNAFGDRYPGAGATIGQGLVFGHIAARHAAGR